MSQWIAVLCLYLCGSALFAQGDDVAKAEALYQTNRRGALPLYEALAKANPKEPRYADRVALCLYAQSAEMSAGPARTELLERIAEEAKNAVALGSRDDASQVIADFDLSLVNGEKGETLAKAIWRSGEPYFGRHDFKEALKRYAAAAELEPKAYEPALFAGDAAQFSDDLQTASYWYQKAVESEPDNAKAYLRWGDAISRIAHDSDGAKAKYIDAIVANPYDPQGRQGLAKWAAAQRAVLAPPQIKPPSGGFEMFTAMGHDPATKTPWATYVVDKFAYETNAKASPIGTFQQDYPGEAKPRRTLIGETKALHAVAIEAATNAEKEGKSAREFRDLIEIDQAGMLECWILFHWADQGIAREYQQFNNAHWKLLHDYVDRFEVHGGKAR